MAQLHGGFRSGRGGGKSAPDTAGSRHEDPRAITNAGNHSNSNSKTRMKSSGNSSSPSSAQRAKAASGATTRVPTLRSSAPINIPNRSKILKKKHGENSLHVACDVHYDDGDEDGDETVPPHQDLAQRRSARTQIAPFSIHEGVGRKLKGKDLINLRDAILKKTAFRE